MMRAASVVLILLPFLVLRGTAAPPVIAAIDVSGCTRFALTDVDSWLAPHLRQPYTPERLDAIAATLRDHYRLEGFYSAVAIVKDAAIAPDSSAVRLTIAVEEGRQAVLASMTILGASAFDTTALASLLESRPGSVLREATLEADIAALLDQYERGGFALAACMVADIALHAGADVDSAAVTLRIDEGPRVVIDEVRVEGNRETDTGVILRETRIGAGEVYDPVRIAAIRSRLNRLNIFSRVDEPELYMNGPRGGLLLRLEEGKTNTFDGIAGYTPGTNPGENGYLTGMVTIGMRNLFGTGRRMNLRWQKEDRHSQDLAVGYVEPWLFDWPVNVGGEFSQRRQDSTWVRQTGTFTLELMASEELALSLLGTTESVIPSSDTATARVPRSSSLGAGAEVLYDTRDDIYSPQGGARYRADYHVARKRVAATLIAPASDENVQRFGVDLEMYMSPFARQVVAIGLHGRQMQGGGFDESQLFRFGGALTMRGYRENQFLGSRIAWTNLEYRLLLGRHSFLYGFLDTGYYFRPGDARASTLSSEAFHYGYGLGLRFETPLGNMGVSFALGKGDSFAQGKIHVGVIGDF